MKLELYKPRDPSERESIVVHIGARPVKNPHISVEAVNVFKQLTALQILRLINGS